MPCGPLPFVVCWFLLDCCKHGNARAAEKVDPEPVVGVEVQTFDWTGGKECNHFTQITTDHIRSKPGSHRLKAVAKQISREPMAKQLDHTAVTTSDFLLDALWDRPKLRNARFGLTKTKSSGEHPCFAGFSSMVNHTNRCNGFVRQYPPVGSTLSFLNTGIDVHQVFTLQAVIAKHINLWLEEGTTEFHADISEKAARIYANDFGIEELRPAEGSSSWMEHECRTLGPLPFVYTCSNRINVLVQQCNEASVATLLAHLYADTTELNSRKFYRIHAMFLAYLAQEQLLGERATVALQNYQSFEPSYEPWGCTAYDYFLRFLGKARPTEFSSVEMDTEDVHNPFAEALLDYRVALASQCIPEGSKRPTQTRYLMPPGLRDRPFWDCSAFPAFYSATSSSVRSAARDLMYGGAAIFRLASPKGATISVAEDADAQVRTKVLAAGDGQGRAAEVRELAPGQSVTFAGKAREVFVVQVNVNPAGKTISPAFWSRTDSLCEGLCKGRAWRTEIARREHHLASVLSTLRSPPLRLPQVEATLSFVAMWDMEPEDVDGSEVASDCPSKGYNGIQVLLHVHDSENHVASRGEETVVVLQPAGGYGHGGGNAAGLKAIANSRLHPADAPCDFFEGWTGMSVGDDDAMAFTRQSFSLAPYAGKSVSVELVVASGEEDAGKGFWVDEIEVRAGSEVLFKDDAEEGDADCDTGGASMV